MGQQKRFFRTKNFNCMIAKLNFPNPCYDFPMKQLALFELKPTVTFGGELNRGKRKIKRPISTKSAIHIVFRSQSHDLKKNESKVKSHWREFTIKFGIKTYKMAVCSNHVHAIIRIHSGDLYKKFVQAFAGTLSKSLAIKWQSRPFTRLLNWGREYDKACRYVEQNWLESMGFIDYRERIEERRRREA